MSISFVSRCLVLVSVFFLCVCLSCVCVSVRPLAVLPVWFFLSLRLFLSIHLCVYLAYGPDPACSPRFMKCEQLSRWCISYSGRLCVGFVPQMKAYDSCETLVAQTQHTDTEAAARAVSTREKTEKGEMRRGKQVWEEVRRREKEEETHEILHFGEIRGTHKWCTKAEVRKLHLKYLLLLLIHKSVR